MLCQLQLRDTLNKRLGSEVENRQAGDLGAESTSVGNFVMMYLGPGKDAHGIRLAAYDTGKAVEAIDSDYFDNVGKPDLNSVFG